MNTYRTTFMVKCPVNGAIIRYTLEIRSRSKILVEHILSAIDDLPSEGFHEDIADRLLLRFGGLHVLRAHHHGVDITTERGQV